MSVSRNPWGSPAAARARNSVNLFNVMDEELAAKLQREEEEQFELEIAGRFGDDRQVGWCFVEVPSAGCEYGVMSVVQQEIPIDERPSASDDDPDYTFALELQAQEAEEYDRLRRQEEASMERIRVIQQTPPKREEIRQTLLQKFCFSESRTSGSDDHVSDEDHHHADDDVEDDGEDADADSSALDSGTGAASASSSPSDWSLVDKDPDCAKSGNVDDDVYTDSSSPQNLHAHTGKQPVASGTLDRVHLRDLEIHRGIYIDGDELGLPRKKLNSLSQTLKHADRKQRAYHHSYHRRPKTHGDHTTETI